MSRPCVCLWRAEPCVNLIFAVFGSVPNTGSSTGNSTPSSSGGSSSISVTHLARQ